MADRALVISEPIYRPAPFQKLGEHYLDAESGDWPELIESLLADEEARGRHVADAGSRVRNERADLRALHRARVGRGRCL